VISRRPFSQRPFAYRPLVGGRRLSTLRCQEARRLDAATLGPNVLQIIATMDAIALRVATKAGDLEVADLIWQRLAVAELLLSAYQPTDRAERLVTGATQSVGRRRRASGGSDPPPPPPLPDRGLTG